MASVPSASNGLFPTGTLAPGTSASAPPDLTIEQYTAMLKESALRLPKCTIPITCGTVGVNDEYAYTRAAPVNCPTCDWWMPLGTIRTQIRSFRVYWHLSQLGNLKSAISQTISENVVPFAGRTSVAEAWQNTSKAQFSNRVNELERARYSTTGDAPLGRKRGGEPIQAQEVSVNRFLTTFPEFVLDYLDQHVPQALRPTQYEMTNEGGVGTWMRRGGYPLHKPTLEGKVPLNNVSLWACAEWCAGCVNPTLYPQGTPTCITSIKIETENFDWGMFVKREPGQYVVSINRLPKKTWDKIEDGIGALTGQLDQFIGWMCRTYQSPTGQVAVGAGAGSSDPYTRYSTQYLNYILANGCRGQSSTGTQTSYDPNAPPPSWKSQTASNTQQIITNVLSPPVSKRRLSATQVGVGVVALGLITAGATSLFRKRRR